MDSLTGLITASNDAWEYIQNIVNQGSSPKSCYQEFWLASHQIGKIGFLSGWSVSRPLGGQMMPCDPESSPYYYY